MLGALEFDRVTFQTSVTPNLRVKVYVASPATASKLAEPLEETEAVSAAYHAANDVGQ